MHFKLIASTNSSATANWGFKQKNKNFCQPIRKTLRMKPEASGGLKTQIFSSEKFSKKVHIILKSKKKKI